MASFVITPLNLKHAYDLLSWTPPFVNLKMPKIWHNEVVTFRVVNHLNGSEWRGSHEWTGRKHIVVVATDCHGTIQSLLETMAHEMIHIYQVETGLPANHGKDFQKLAKLVCDVHGFDLKRFY